MKKKRNEIMRIENIINNDRMSVGDEFYDVLTLDLENLLRDYFDFNEPPVVEISKQNGSYCVKIGLIAGKLLHFSKIPK